MLHAWNNGNLEFENSDSLETLFPDKNGEEIAFESERRNSLAKWLTYSNRKYLNVPVFVSYICSRRSIVTITWLFWSTFINKQLKTHCYCVVVHLLAEEIHFSFILDNLIENEKFL